MRFLCLICAEKVMEQMLPTDADKHFEALNAGGDDFLSKPIRPKHLISAVIDTTV